MEEMHPVTPRSLLASHEATGDPLLELNRALDAMEACKSGLSVWLGRYIGLLGAARAARGNCGGAASDRPEGLTTCGSVRLSLL